MAARSHKEEVHVGATEAWGSGSIGLYQVVMADTVKGNLILHALKKSDQDLLMDQLWV